MYRFGAYQLSGGHVALAQDASRLGLVLAAAAVIGWRLLIASRPRQVAAGVRG